MLAATTVLLLLHGVLGCASEDPAPITSGGVGGAGTTTAGDASTTAAAIGAGGASVATSTATTAGATTTGGFGSTTTGSATTGTFSTTASTTAGFSTSGTSSTSSTTGAGGGSSGDCTITANVSTSTAIGTVGIVTWSTDLAGLSSAEIHFRLDDGSGRERVAPVDLNEPEYRTLLLGMKQNKSYNVQIVATAGGTTCSSEVYSVATGSAGNINITQTANNASAIAEGFIILSGGIGNGGNSAYIVDEDGDVVWAASSPNQTSRAKMDWEGKNMYMLSLNVQNGGGGVSRVSMDGLDTEGNVSGLSSCHHDFTVAPGGIVTCPSWSSNGMDPPSDIIERAPDGTVTTIARDSNLYSSGSYHSNSIHYHQADDSYTLGDRNPNLYVKFSRSSGQVQWQFGGSGSTFSGVSSWQVNHGHHLLDNGNFLFFNNGQGGNSSPVFEYSLSTNSASQVWTYSGGGSMVLGDVQRLGNGNTLVTYSTNGVIQEVNTESSVVRQLSAGSFGYADHRPTLYGPPAR